MKETRVAIEMYMLKNSSWNIYNGMTKGDQILKISDDFEVLVQIVKSKTARDKRFVWRDKYHCLGVDTHGSFECYSIEKVTAELSDAAVGDIGRIAERRNRMQDVEEFLQGAYEEGEIEETVYRCFLDSPAAKSQILNQLDKSEDCNIPYNDFLEYVINQVIKSL